MDAEIVLGPRSVCFLKIDWGATEHRTDSVTVVPYSVKHY
jgi:hypothetical protein